MTSHWLSMICFMELHPDRDPNITYLVTFTDPCKCTVKIGDLVVLLTILDWVIRINIV